MLLQILFILAPLIVFAQTTVRDPDQPRPRGAIGCDLLLLGAAVLVFLLAYALGGFLGGAVFLLPVAILAKLLLIDLSRPTSPAR